MRDPILLLRRHFRERLLRPARLEPGVPSEMLIAPRLHQNLAHALAEKDLPFAAVPVRDAALRSCGAIVQRIRNGGESSSACRFEQPANIRPREISELVEAERGVLDNKTAIALRASGLELVARDLLARASLKLRKHERDSGDRH